MEILEVLQAYETLKTYGIEIPSLKAKTDVVNQRNPNPNPLVGGTQLEKREEAIEIPSILVGDIEKQRSFLRGELQNDRKETEGRTRSHLEEVTMELKNGEEKKNFSELSLFQIIELRKTINEIYGEGVLDSILREEVADLLNSLKADQIQVARKDESGSLEDNTEG